MNDKLRQPFFVVLLAPFFVLNGYNIHYGFIPVPDALKLLGVYLAATIIIFLLAFLIFRNKVKASVFSFVIMAVNFFFGAFQDSLKNAFDNSPFARYTFLLPAILLGIILLFLFLKRTRRSLGRLTIYLNVLLTLLIFIEIFSIGYKKITRKKPDEMALAGGYTACNSCDRPDVYIIITDEYAGKNSLREVFNFNNEPFLKALKDRGFFIPSKSFSNYNFTPYSIASTLNMDYLDIEKKSTQELLLHTYQVTASNNLLRFFINHGYEFFNYSLIDYPNHPSHVKATFLPVKTRLITSQTLLRRIDKDLRFNLVTKLHSRKEKRRLVYTPQKNNEKLINLTKNVSGSKPRFVFTHLMMPHYPYYFNRDGKPFPFDQLLEGNQVNKENYIEYLQYCNKILLTLVDEIKRNSTHPPIIFLLGDHGFRHFSGNTNPENFFDNLMSFQIPGADYSNFPDTLSNVNLFRALLNNRFNQKLPYLPDSTFIMKNP